MLHENGRACRAEVGAVGPRYFELWRGRGKPGLGKEQNNGQGMVGGGANVVCYVKMFAQFWQNMVLYMCCAI